MEYVFYVIAMFTFDRSRVIKQWQIRSGTNHGDLLPCFWPSKIEQSFFKIVVDSSILSFVIVLPSSKLVSQ